MVNYIFIFTCRWSASVFLKLYYFSPIKLCKLFVDSLLTIMNSHTNMHVWTLQGLASICLLRVVCPWQSICNWTLKAQLYFIFNHWIPFCLIPRRLPHPLKLVSLESTVSGLAAWLKFNILLLRHDKHGFIYYYIATCLENIFWYMI